jgi:hypothetical protein
MNSQILEKVEASGVCGIKKTELKKLFSTDCELTLDNLVKEDKIIVDKKGVAHYVWSKDNYLTHVSQNDPKFKIISKIIKNLENSVNQLKACPANSDNSSFDFKTKFDQTIIELSTSLGWVPFSNIRQKICESLDISAEKFYSLATSVIESNQSKYEISTGGQEGILVRGLLHGYVRKL